MKMTRSDSTLFPLFPLLFSVLITAGLCPMAFGQSTCKKPASCEVVVDGITGKIVDAVTCKLKADQTTTCQRTWPVVYPGDEVVVKVTRANLIDYGYTIEVKEEALSLVYPVVGVGELSVSDSLGTGGTPTAGEPAAVDFAKAGLDDLGKAYVGLAGELLGHTAKVSLAIRPVEELERRGNATWKGARTGWPSEYQDRINSLLGSGDESVGKLRKDLATFEATALAYELRAIAIDVLAPPAAGGLHPAAVLATRFKTLAQEARSLQGELTKTELKVRRWDAIISIQDPIVEKIFQVDRKSQRYKVTVTRQPLNETAAKTDPGFLVAPASGDPKKEAKPAGSILASFTFEGHAWHRFNVSLGVAETYTPDARTFGIVPTIGEDDKVTYNVRRTANLELNTQAIALLGIYFNRVDNYDPDRKPAWMLTLGTEISASPENYLLGVGVDFASGLMVGFGLRDYNAVELEKGWSDGQAVPTKDDGMPLIATPPTTSKDSFGYYFTVGFRPAIFKAFWSRRK